MAENEVLTETLDELAKDRRSGPGTYWCFRSGEAVFMQFYPDGTACCPLRIYPLNQSFRSTPGEAEAEGWTLVPEGEIDEVLARH